MGTRFTRDDIKLLADSGEYTDEELEDLIIIGTPSLWCEHNLRHPDAPQSPLEVRSYQKDMIDSRAKNKMMRCGRRIGKTVVLVCEALWAAATEKNIRVVIIAPYKENIKEIERVMSNMALNSSAIKESIIKYERDPLLIEFTNGSQIKCLPANKNPDIIRGKGCNHLYIDEADYLNDEARKAVISLLMTKAECNICHNEIGNGCKHRAGEVYILDGSKIECNPNPLSSLWASSTPSGSRGWFYQQCKLARKYMDTKGNYNEQRVEFHLPSWNSPLWGEAMEKRMREEIPDETDWIHEVEADFGESRHSVYKSKFIDAAIKRGYEEITTGNTSKLIPYTYDMYRIEKKEDRRHNCRYIFGVDWNGEKHGVQICILGIEMPNPDIIKNRKEYTSDQLKVILRPVDRIEISVQEFTQTAAITTITNLNNIYQPDVICVDEGYGAVQIEELKKYANKFPETKIKERLMTVKFGSNVEVPDPFNENKPSKKSMKQFMISNLQWLLESNSLLLPEQEDVRGGLVDQIRSYSVKGYTFEGKPQYEKIIDHAHDALILACYAFRDRIAHVDQPIDEHEISLFHENPLLTSNPIYPSSNINRDIEFTKEMVSDIDDDPFFNKNLRDDKNKNNMEVYSVGDIAIPKLKGKNKQKFSRRFW